MSRISAPFDLEYYYNLVEDLNALALELRAELDRLEKNREELADFIEGHVSGAQVMRPAGGRWFVVT